MASDASIYSMIRPAAPPPNPIEQYSHGLALSNMMGQQQIQGLQTQKLSNDLQGEAAFKKLFQDGATPTDTQAIAADPTRGMAYGKARIDRQKSEAELLKTDLENARNRIASTATDADLSRLREDVMRKQGPTAAADIPPSVSDPSFAQWKQTHMMNADKALELVKSHLQAVPLGGKTSLVEMNKNAAGFDPNVDLTHTATISDTEAMRHNPVMEKNAAGRLSIAAGHLTEQKRHNAEAEKALNPWGQAPASGAAPQPGATQSPQTPEQAMQSLTTTPINAEALSKMPPALAAQVKATIEGQIPLPPQSRNNPRNAQLRDAVLLVDPSMIEQRNKIRNSYFGATQSKEKETLTNLNQAYAHAGTLFDLTKAMNNHDLPAANAAVNWVKANVNGSADVTNPEVAKQALSEELMRTFRGAGQASEKEAERFGNALKAMNGSPAQQEGALRTASDLLDKRLKIMEEQYTQGMGHERFKRDLLLPSAKASYAKLHSGAPTSSAAPTPAATRITGDDGYNALPKGALYIGPDGVQRTK